MAALIREALEIAFEGEMDVVAGERALEEAARDPSKVTTLKEYLEKRGLVVPPLDDAARKPRPRRTAG